MKRLAAGFIALTLALPLGTWGLLTWADPLRGHQEAAQQGRQALAESMGRLTMLRRSLDGLWGTPEPMTASWYGIRHQGKLTASGEPFNRHSWTAAHRTLPIGTVLLVEHGGKRIAVRVNDRGPAEWTGRELDLSERAAHALGMREQGEARVITRRLR